ncbi:MAG: sulfotransferase domain-containing protein [Planctomycetota bacterium]
MGATKTLENLARRYLPPPMARAAKRYAVHARYRAQASACRAGFEEFGDRYPEKILFIAGLPKSGTTWLEKMISSWPGYHELLIPDVADYELKSGGSHDYDLPGDTFSRMSGMLVLSKMHVHGSPHNARVLKDAGVPYAVLFRDLRDVAVSNFFYVRNTPWHPEHPHYADVSVEQGLATFAERTLPAYAEWVRSWQANRDPERSLVLRYEELLADVRSRLAELAGLFRLDASDERLTEIAERNSFRSMSGGREAGQADGSAFVRKGVAGDWVNHFTPSLKDTYKDAIGGFLIEFEYEQDLDW